jgi:hypothetical protein
MSTDWRPDLTDEQIDGICDGLTQAAAKIRHLQSLGLRVARRPNGRPLVARAEWERVFGRPPEAQPTAGQGGGTGPRWRVAA